MKATRPLERDAVRRLRALVAGAAAALALVPAAALALAGVRGALLWTAALGGLALGVLGAWLLSRVCAGAIRELLAAAQQSRDALQRAEASAQKTTQDLSRWVASAVEEVRALSERIVQIHESERGRMARDLHDSVGQALAALQLDLQLLRSRTDDPVLVARALSACDEAMQSLRSVVYDLRPPELSASADVRDVLRAYVERFEIRTGVPTSFRPSGQSLCSEEIATCLLRVLQEALTNVRRHAFAREVGVALRVEPSEVVLEIKDDGQGFDTSTSPRGRGLQGIHERCAFLGGKISLDSGPERGTRLEVHLPLARSTS